MVPKEMKRCVIRVIAGLQNICEEGEQESNDS